MSQHPLPEEPRHYKAHWETQLHQAPYSTLRPSIPALDTSPSKSFKACWDLQATGLGPRSPEKILALEMGAQ